MLFDRLFSSQYLYVKIWLGKTNVQVDTCELDIHDHVNSIFTTGWDQKTCFIMKNNTTFQSVFL